MFCTVKWLACFLSRVMLTSLWMPLWEAVGKMLHYLLDNWLSLITHPTSNT